MSENFSGSSFKLLLSDFDALDQEANEIITASYSLVLFEIKIEKTGRFNGSKPELIFILTFRLYSEKKMLQHATSLFNICFEF